jgi:hypothetical protein
VAYHNLTEFGHMSYITEQFQDATQTKITIPHNRYPYTGSFVDDSMGARSQAIGWMPPFKRPTNQERFLPFQLPGPSPRPSHWNSEFNLIRAGSDAFPSFPEFDSGPFSF